MSQIQRVLNDTLELPNTLHDLEFPQNGVSGMSTFNSKFSKINENFQYCLNQAQILNSVLPFDYAGVYYFDPTYKGWDTTISSYEPAVDHGFTNLAVVERRIVDNKYLYIYSKDQSLEFYIGDNLNSTASYDDLELIYTYSNIQKDFFEFSKIERIFIDNGLLYVIDSVKDIIIVYNILPIITGDTAFIQLQIVKRIFDKKAISLTFDDTYLYMYTTDNILWKYDKNFNIIKQSVVDTTKTLRDLEVTAGFIYLLYTDGTITKYSIELQFIEEKQLQNILNNVEEIYLRLSVSQIDGDIVYILSDNYIHKCFFSKLEKNIGYFNLDLEQTTYLDFYILRDDSNPITDTIFLLDSNKMHLFLEKNEYKFLYDVGNIVGLFDISALSVGDDELEQDFVFNSLFQKVLYNHFLLYNSLIYRILLKYDENGNAFFAGFQNLVRDEVLTDISSYFGLNEVYSSQIFNRIIIDVYSIQEKILNLLKEKKVLNNVSTLVI